MARTNTPGGRRLIEIGVTTGSFSAHNLNAVEFDKLSSEAACELIRAINRGDHADEDVNQAFDDALDLLKDHGEDRFDAFCGNIDGIRAHGLVALLQRIPAHESDEDEEFQEEEDEYDMHGISKVEYAVAEQEQDESYAMGNDGNQDSD